MMNKLYLLVSFLLCTVVLAEAQNEYADYRSATNPYYWKNRKPYEGYWQQDVHYNIKAEINDSTDILTGEEELIYWNNSPYSLGVLYFHLYSNAQTKDSYAADLYKNNHYNLTFSKYRNQNLGTQVSSVSMFGKVCRTELDNTILKVYLTEPVKPGESITLNLAFKTYFDKEAIRNRMKVFNSFGKKHYDVVHWYPRVTVVDQKFVWNTDQHMDHEFYGDFGSYHVEMTMPAEYVADGTGVLINEKEVLPSELRKQLDITNFLQKPFNSPPTEILKKDGTKKTWKFSAINVHDFAFTADPNYRIGEKVWNGVRCIALVQEPHAAGWYNATSLIAKILEVNTYNIGEYPHPKMIVADAQDGMEYPMLTLCGGFDPGYRSLIIHEMTHNWFQGMLGSNENYRAWMDEGFTQFYTADTYQFIDGPVVVEQKPNGSYYEKFTETVRVLDDELYNGYYNRVVTNEEQVILNTHADDFNGGIRHGGGYGQSYMKTAVMLKNLEYVLGRALFDKSMQHYFKKWRFCHPYPEDFRQAIIEYAGVDLNWFFDQWLETTKTIDYSIDRAKKLKNGNYAITFTRRGTMQMPLDFAVIDKNDSAHHYYIPNTWFEKPTSATVLPRWIGWGPKLKTSYTATVNVGGPITNVILDPSFRMADVNMINNTLHKRLHLRFDSKVYNPSDWKRYEMRIRPGLWYNAYDGIKPAFVVSGDYLKSRHVFEFIGYAGTGLGQYGLSDRVNPNNYQQFSFILDYKTSLSKMVKRGTIYAQAKSLDGLDGLMVGMDKKWNNDRTRFYMHLKAMLRDQARDTVYLIHSNAWGYQKLNSGFYSGIEHKYALSKSSGTLQANLRTSAFTNAYDYAYANAAWINRQELGKFTLATRAFVQGGTGNNIPYESMLYAAGANNEELMDNKYTRSAGFVPATWGNYGIVTNHFTAGGGLNLRGYSGYLLAQQMKDGSVRYNYRGTTGGAINAELEFGKLFKKFNPKFLKNAVKLTPYLFADAGVLNTNAPGKPLTYTSLMVDAGAGATISIVRWGRLFGLKPLNIRIDVPFFINRLPFAEKDYVQMRWIIGVNRAF
jgi:aminopeptidase N